MSPRNRSVSIVLWILCGAGAGSAGAQDLQVNAYTTGDQESPSVAMDADGDFVVAWQSTDSGGGDTAGTSIQGQRYASDGSTAGGQFQVNTYTTGDQERPSVAMDAAGDFVVVWQSGNSSGSDTSGTSIQGQRYTSGGSTVGGEFQVNSYTTNYQRKPAVSIDDAGEFVVVWASDGSSGTDGDGYSIQRAGAASVPVDLTSFTVE